MIRLCFIAMFAAAAFALPQPASAVFSGDMSPRPESGDADYAAGIRARNEMEWEKMIVELEKVVARRPWHDNAHNLLGYGYRKIGNYEKSLVHYHTALKLNPRHRQALNYLGMAYLHMEDRAKAETTLAKLGEVCKQVRLTFSDGDFSDGCREYRKLEEQVAFYDEYGFVIETCPSEEEW
ncbi:MAG: tetratricopeptide repeat protein [Pseudomonadota bacterium]